MAVCSYWLVETHALELLRFYYQCMLCKLQQLEEELAELPSEISSACDIVLNPSYSRNKPFLWHRQILHCRRQCLPFFLIVKRFVSAAKIVLFEVVFPSENSLLR